MTIYDFAIVGAGIAGASLAAELAGHASVLLLEAEDTTGYHATGRSAAFWDECYGGPRIVPLTLASGPYLREHGFLSPRGALYIGRDQDKPALEEFFDRFADTGVSLERVDQQRLKERIPGLKPVWTSALWEPACADIDVGGLHAHYLKRGREGGVELVTRARLAEAKRRGSGWQLRTEKGDEYRTGILVNAAGAWADEIAEIAGVRSLGIQPFLRSIVQLRTDPPVSPEMPLVLDISGRFYFKPEAGRLWLSPHDEVPSDPCDAAPEELAVAEAIDRLTGVVNWRIERVEHRWAGLRSFAPDRLPAYGWDPERENFAWFAGQGGYGIQTAPAAARLTAQILLGLGRDEMTEGLNASLYSPLRFY